MVTKNISDIKALTENSNNLNQFLIDAKRVWPKKDSMQYLKGGEYYGINWEETYKISRWFCLGLMSLGIYKGVKVGIFSKSRYEWRLSDYGILLAGGCSVTLYPSITPAQVEYIVNDSGLKILFVGTARLLKKVLSIKDNCQNLTHIIVIEPINDSLKSEIVLSLDDLISKGKEYYKSYVPKRKDKAVKKFKKKIKNKEKWISKSFDKAKNREELNKLYHLDAEYGKLINDPFIERYHSIEPDDLASIVYTSGTTGVPKGAMLSHKNFYSNVINTLKAVPMSENDISLSFLPLSHVLERLTGHFMMTKLAATVAYARDTDSIIENLEQIKPTYMTAVPRIFEKLWDKLIAKIEEEGGTKEKIFWHCYDWGWDYQKNIIGGEDPSFMEKVKNKLAHTLVFKQIQEKLGGRIRYMFSGGAALRVQIANFFQAADIKILEGYGLTETSPVLTVNPLGKPKPGTVGVPIPDTEVKIAEDGEIVAKGPQVFHGYINKPDETAASFNADGFYLTGDLGEYDEEGYLKITGRKKTLIVLRTGKKVSPVMVEEEIKTSRFIEQVCLVGDDKKFITAVILPNFEFVGQWARDNNITKYKDEDLVVDDSTTREKYANIVENRRILLKSNDIAGFINSVVSESQQNIADFERAKKFVLVAEDWNEYNEMLTPSLKMKRRNITKFYEKQISEMYGD